MITGAQAIIKCLEEKQVEYIFGYPGLAVCPIYDEMLNSSIKHILVRQEQNAGHNANGYARISGKPGVCMTTSGPGAANLITALATAHTDSIPIIAFTGQVAKDLIGTDSFQEADIFGCTQPFVKHSYMVMDANDIPRIINEAFYIANTGRKGPVLIDIPMDVQNQVMDEFEQCEQNDVQGYHVPKYASEASIKEVIDIISSAKKPLICVGGGVHLSDARDEVITLSEKYNIPAIGTMMGIGTFPSTHRNYFGMLGSHGKKYSNYAINKSDVLIIFGARVGNRAFGNPKAINKSTTIIHVEIDPAEIGKNIPANVSVIGDIKCVINQILEHDINLNTAKWIEELNAEKAKYIFDHEEREGSLNPKGFVRMLSLAMDDDSIYCADVGQNQIWSSNNVLMRGGRFLTSGGMGTMGYSIPAAIGAAFAADNKQVVAVCGDGSFQMSMCELATAIQYKLNVKIVIMKNNYLGMVREAQVTSFKNGPSGVWLGDDLFDICTLVSAYGIPGEKVHSLKEAKSAIDRMLKSEGVYVLECYVDPSEKSL
ncbi:MAG: biosynthetic-type acetolactate synthase large subunit [Clostridia bacterium]|nr:biosynthetic-type acetolactate synthase large subunit [Clostridia bacterium]